MPRIWAFVDGGGWIDRGQAPVHVPSPSGWRLPRLGQGKAQSVGPSDSRCSRRLPRPGHRPIFFAQKITKSTKGLRGSRHWNLVGQAFDEPLGAVLCGLCGLRAKPGLNGIRAGGSQVGQGPVPATRLAPKKLRPDVEGRSGGRNRDSGKTGKKTGNTGGKWVMYFLAKGTCPLLPTL